MGSPLEDRTRRFMLSLADGPTDAANISAERTESGVRVTCDLPGPEVNKAQSVAAGHGFTLYGRVGDGAGGRGRYSFTTYERAGEPRREGGLGLPGELQ